MHSKGFSRRDFSKLSAAAFGGVVTGGSATSAFADHHEQQEEKKDYGVDPALLLQEPHVCRGLNTCQGKGGCQTASNACKGQNACAGAGGAPTVAEHVCQGMNACKGQGGCGGYPGQNSTCKGHGQCAVPLSKETWAIARKQFEQLAKAAEIKVNPAPKES